MLRMLLMFANNHTKHFALFALVTAIGCAETSNGGAEASTRSGSPRRLDQVPETIIDVAPGLETSATEAQFEFHCEISVGAICTFECSLDGGPFEGCSSGTEFSGLATTSHEFEVRAITNFGTVDTSPAISAWTVVNLSGSDDEGAIGNFNVSILHNQIAADSNSSCAIRDGLLYCWGYFRPPLFAAPNTNHNSVPTSLYSFEGLLDVEIGFRVGCVIDSAYRLYCWGDNTFGQLGEPQIVSGSPTFNPPKEIDSTQQWLQVALGGGHSCALSASSELFCWGDNSFGQLGIGVLGGEKTVPQKVKNPSGWKFVDSGGGRHTCAISRNGELHCWGKNPDGRLGDGTNLDRLEPTPVNDLGTWETVSIGMTHSCGIKMDRSLWCWGSGMRGQLGLGSLSNKSVPVKVGNQTWNRVSAGFEHTCAITTENKLYCWGRNDWRQAGSGDQADKLVPFQVSNSSNWSDVSVGGHHACAENNAGDIYCWGNDSSGQLGRLSQLDLTEPVLVNNEVTWKDVMASDTSSCAMSSFGELYCWGAREYGMPNSEVGGYVLEPTRIGDDSDWGNFLGHQDEYYIYGGVSAGGTYEGYWRDDNFPLTTFKKGYGFGFATKGETLQFWGRANPSHQGIVQARDITDVSAWDQLAKSVGHTCGIRNAGDLYCWGLGSYGQLGLGTLGKVEQPSLVEPAGAWKKVGVGQIHTCAIRIDGGLYCWGTDLDLRVSGSLVSSGDVSTPTQIAVGQNWVDLSVSTDFTCAIDSNFGMYCWGKNSSGQSRANSHTNESAIAQIGTNLDWEKIFAGRGRTCGIRQGGVLQCWGGGDYSISDYGPNWNIASPGLHHVCAINLIGNLYCWGDPLLGGVGFDIWGLGLVEFQ